MSLLSPDYYNDLRAEKEKKVQQPQTQQATVEPVPQNNAVGGNVRNDQGPLITPGIPRENVVGLSSSISGSGVAGSTPSIADPNRPGIADTIEKTALDFSDSRPISEKRQIEKYGGPVGSAEYYNYKSQNPFTSYFGKQVASSLGIRFPDEETWDKMSGGDQALYFASATLASGVRLISDLPKEVVRAPIRVGLTIAAPWKEMAQGKPGSLESLREAEPAKIPWLGEVPTYYHTFDQARKSGLGPLAATLQTAGLAAGDVSIVGALGETVTTAFRPKGTPLKQGEQVKNTQPIKEALVKEESGAPKVVTKSDSLSEYYSLPRSVVKDNFKGNPNNTFLKLTPMGENSVEVAVVQVRSGTLPRTVDYVKSKFGLADRVYKGDFGNEVKLQSQTIKTNKPVLDIPPGAGPDVLESIPPKPLKGFENKAVTTDQITHLYQIAEVNGIGSGIRDSVIRTITGKKGVGELTQAEYVKTAQALAGMKNMNKYSPSTPEANIFARYGSPQRNWMRRYEEKSGIPLYSEVYVPMEEAIRTRNVFRNSMRNEARDVFGKYAGQGFGEERRLVSAYMKGEKSAILDNPALNQATKNDLVEIATKMREMYDRVGPQVDVPTEVFLKDYQPSVQNIGGVYQLYKEGAGIPKEIEFFAKFKKHGNLNVQVDDALALWDIYTNAGSNRVFLNPVLERIGNLANKLPAELHNSVRSYTLEKMGYAGPLDKWVDNLATNLNKKLGTNLPQDASRKFAQVAMDTTYSGALGANPGKAIRNLIQNDLMTYPRLGPRFYVDAAKKALTKEGIAEVRRKGFLVELGVPYGEELTKDVALEGRVGNTYRKVTQGSLEMYSQADVINRARTYWQGKMLFEDAVGKYNQGKITWAQAEKELDLGAMSPVDRNIIRQRLVDGNVEGAFDNFIREVLDETHFPYRRGSSSRITYGLGGKVGTQFLQWPIEFSHTHGRWIRTGQFDKVIRFWAASATISRSIKESIGIDFTRDSFFNPLSPGFSPFVRGAIDTVELISASIQKNLDAIEENKDSLARAVKSLLVPAGASIENVKNFYKSYEAGPIGPDSTYPVYDSSGKLKYYTNFKDLWLQLWGFRTAEETQEQNLLNNMRNAKFNYTQAKNRVLELYQQEKYDEANDLISKFGIQIRPDDFDRYYIPLSERTLNSIPVSQRANFVPQVFSK